MNIATHTYSVEEIVSLLKSKKWQDDNLIPIINNPHFKTENWYFAEYFFSNIHKN